MILWDIRDLSHNQHKTLRFNIEFDYANFVSWSPDSKAFIIHTVRENNIVVYKTDKKKDGALGSATQVLAFDKVSECFNTEQMSLGSQKGNVLILSLHCDETVNFISSAKTYYLLSKSTWKNVKCLLNF